MHQNEMEIASWRSGLTVKLWGPYGQYCRAGLAARLQEEGLSGR